MLERGDLTSHGTRVRNKFPTTTIVIRSASKPMDLSNGRDLKAVGQFERCRCATDVHWMGSWACRGRSAEERTKEPISIELEFPKNPDPTLLCPLPNPTAFLFLGNGEIIKIIKKWKECENRISCDSALSWDVRIRFLNYDHNSRTPVGDRQSLKLLWTTAIWCPHPISSIFFSLFIYIQSPLLQGKYTFFLHFILLFFCLEKKY